MLGVQLVIIKAELCEIMKVLPIIQSEYRIEVLRKLRKLLPTARRLVEETGDKELNDFLASITSCVENIKG